MVLFISIKTLKEQYLIDDNLDDRYIISIIKKGQDFIIKSLLGNLKYKQLINDIDNSNISQSDELLIKEYIQPVLAYYVMSEVVYATAYKFKNNPEYQNNPDTNRFDELIRISKKYLIDSQHYEQILRNYICSEGIILSSDDNLGVGNSGYKTGLYLD